MFFCCIIAFTSCGRYQAPGTMYISSTYILYILYINQLFILSNKLFSALPNNHISLVRTIVTCFALSSCGDFLIFFPIYASCVYCYELIEFHINYNSSQSRIHRLHDLATLGNLSLDLRTTRSINSINQQALYSINCSCSSGLSVIIGESNCDCQKLQHGKKILLLQLQCRLKFSFLFLLVR